MDTQVLKSSTILEPKQFHRRLEAILDLIHTSGSNDSQVQLFLSGFRHYLAEDLHVCAIQLYDTIAGPPALLSSWGKFTRSVETLIPPDGANEPFPWFGQWNGRLAAVFPFGERTDLVFVFFFSEMLEETIFLTTLASYFSTLHYALVQHFRRLKLQNALEEAREIQLSLLPSESPRLGGFDIAARTIPARIVGGDIYDFFPTKDETLILMIADAAGHGLPAFFSGDPLGFFSPDGKWLAYVSDESGQLQLYVARFPGARDKQQISTDGALKGFWRQDGKEILYVTREKKLVGVPVVQSGDSIQIGQSYPLFMNRIMPNSNVAISKDGQRLLMAIPVEEQAPPVTLVTNWTATLQR